MPLTKIQGNALAAALVTTSSITVSNTITSSGNNIFTGNATFNNFTFYNEASFEKANIFGGLPNANIVVNLIDTPGIVYCTNNATSNVTVNFTGFLGIQTGNIASAVVILTNNTNPKYISTIQVEGTSTGVTSRWQGGAPTSGTANVEVYSFNIIKTDASSYTVLGSKTNFQ